MEKETLKKVGSQDGEQRRKQLKDIAFAMAGLSALMLMIIGFFSIESVVDDCCWSVMRRMTKTQVDGLKVDETSSREMDSIALYKKGKKWGFYNQNTGERLFKSQDGKSLEFDEVTYFSEGLAAVVKDGKIGFVDMTGKVVIPFQFSRRAMGDLKGISFKHGHCAMTGSYRRWGVIDRQGRWAVKPAYEQVNLLPECVYASTESGRQKLSYRGEVLEKDVIVRVEPLSRDDVRSGCYVYYTRFADSDWSVNRCGIMDGKCTRLTAPIYCNVEMLEPGLFACRLLDGRTLEIKRF